VQYTRLVKIPIKHIAPLITNLGTFFIKCISAIVHETDSTNAAAVSMPTVHIIRYIIIVQKLLPSKPSAPVGRTTYAKVKVESRNSEVGSAFDLR